MTVTPSPHHPIGAKGIGESATVGSPPAIVNAICDALQRRAHRHAVHPVASLGGHAVIPAHRIEALVAAREPFVVATVVRAAKPTSVRPGDSALVFADGTIEGFVGGVCAQESVRLHAARALETGEATLLRLLPGLAIDRARPARRRDRQPQPLPERRRLGDLPRPAARRPADRRSSATPRSPARWRRSPRAAGYDVGAAAAGRTTPRWSSPPTARTRRRRSPPRWRPASTTSRSSPRPSAAPRCSRRWTRRCARASTRPPAWTSAPARPPTSRSRSSPS